MASCTCPNCGHTFPAPAAPRATRNRRSKYGAGDHLWTRVDFADGVTILRSGYHAEGDYTKPRESAIRMRAAAMVGANYSLADTVRVNVPAIVSTRHVTGDEIDATRMLALQQRMGTASRPGWGACLTDPDTHWIRREIRERRIERKADALVRMAYKKGFGAGQADIGTTACEYDPDSDAGRAWFRGWGDAKGTALAGNWDAVAAALVGGAQ